MANLDEIKGRLMMADENLLDVRSDMEEDIRAYMLATNEMPLEVDVMHDGANHHVTISIEPLDEDGDGDADLLFDDEYTGATGLKIYDTDLSSELLSGICITLADVRISIKQD